MFYVFPIARCLPVSVPVSTILLTKPIQMYFGLRVSVARLESFDRIEHDKKGVVDKFAHIVTHKNSDKQITACASRQPKLRGN